MTEPMDDKKLRELEEWLEIPVVPTFEQDYPKLREGHSIIRALIRSHDSLVAENEKLKGKCIICENVPDEVNRASICRKCYVTNAQLRAERDKAIEVLAQTQEALAEEK